MIVLRVFAPFAFAYFVSHVLRAVNAVIAPDLVADLGLDAAALGLLTSVYFLAYGAVQIPLGISLDRFGPRRTEAALLLVGAGGALVFALAESVPVLALGRALIGVGFAACLMAAFKAYRMWFKEPGVPFVNGCQMTVGGLGAIAATEPVELALGFVHWRTLFLVVGALTLVAAAILFLVVPEREGEHRAGGGLLDQTAGVVQVFTSPVFWRVAPLVVTTHAASFATQTLWAGPWLRDVAGLDRAGVAHYLFVTAAAMTIGFFLQGWAAERLQRRGVPIMTVTLAGLAVFLAVQLLLALGTAAALTPMWIVFGMTGGIAILAYADLPPRFPPALSGRVITGMNLLVFTSAFAAQWGIGWIIGRWPTAPGGGYAPDAYRWAFGLMLAVEAAAFAWYFMFRPGEAPAPERRPLR